MAKTPSPLAAVEVALPEGWLALHRARLRVAVAQSMTGRLATLAGAAAAGVGLFTGDYTGASLLADAALTLAGLGTLRVWKPEGHQRATASVLYLMPGASLAALLVAERIVPGIHWGEAAALAVWTVGTWVTRPAEVARRMLAPPPSYALAPVEEPKPQVVCDHPVAGWWAHNVAVEGGAGPRTALNHIERTGEQAMRAIICSTVPGQPVPDISKKRLSALMNVPENDITIGPVPGCGSAYQFITVGQPDEDRTPATVWADKIAPKAMPGTVLTSVRSGRPPVPDEED
ncbi:hypothetical protein [Nonomuraea zeae]|uniref:Uncharacterized protein n=1 Tax=Nonomuraea zeae TaxID=1642303 RepID=A0A5S4H2U7_9ACTN|nr:hypothetical protein [Nonomuraea zeae]TMR39578.1 hypothetical protein ETD85_00770 [Nonomuraea zeae]